MAFIGIPAECISMDSQILTGLLDRVSAGGRHLGFYCCYHDNILFAFLYFVERYLVNIPRYSYESIFFKSVDSFFNVFLNYVYNSPVGRYNWRNMGFFYSSQFFTNES